MANSHCAVSAVDAVFTIVSAFDPTVVIPIFIGYCAYRHRAAVGCPVSTDQIVGLKGERSMSSPSKLLEGRALLHQTELIPLWLASMSSNRCDQRGGGTVGTVIYPPFGIGIIV